MLRLILGGVRSGKSRRAEQLARTSGKEVVYIATSTIHDDEMAARVDAHRERRPAAWRTVECPITLAQTLNKHAAPERILLVECLTLWLTNLLCAEDENQLAREREAFVTQLNALPGELILVSNETGLGVIPMGELSRRFCDEAGTLHQRIAALADQVTLVVAGLPHHLKGAEYG